MSKNKLELLKILREINELEKINSRLSISSLYNKNNIDIINSNNLLILEKKDLLETIKNKDLDNKKNNHLNIITHNIKENNKNKINMNDDDPRNDTNEEKEIESKPSLQDLNMIKKKELLKNKEEKRLVKELLYSRT